MGRARFALVFLHTTLDRGFLIGWTGDLGLERGAPGSSLCWGTLRPFLFVPSDTSQALGNARPPRRPRARQSPSAVFLLSPFFFSLFFLLRKYLTVWNTRPGRAVGCDAGVARLCADAVRARVSARRGRSALRAERLVSFSRVSRQRVTLRLGRGEMRISSQVPLRLFARAVARALEQRDPRRRKGRVSTVSTSFPSLR